MPYVSLGNIGVLAVAGIVFQVLLNLLFQADGIRALVLVNPHFVAEEQERGGSGDVVGGSRSLEAIPSVTDGTSGIPRRKQRLPFGGEAPGLSDSLCSLTEAATEFDASLKEWVGSGIPALPVTSGSLTAGPTWHWCTSTSRNAACGYLVLSAAKAGAILKQGPHLGIEQSSSRIPALPDTPLPPRPAFPKGT